MLVSTYLVDREPDTEILNTHFPLLAAILLHDGHKARTLSIPIIILLQINDELRILYKSGVVTTPSAVPVLANQLPFLITAFQVFAVCERASRVDSSELLCHG